MKTKMKIKMKKEIKRKKEIKNKKKKGLEKGLEKDIKLEKGLGLGLEKDIKLEKGLGLEKDIKLEKGLGLEKYIKFESELIKGNKKEYLVLSNYDIINNRFFYDTETIEWNIKNYNIGVTYTVKNQKLTPYICAKYIIFGGRNEKYADCTEDAWIDTYNALYYQPHITFEQLYEAHRIANKEDDEEDDQEEERIEMSKEDNK